MIYIFENGRMVYDKSLLKPEDEGKYLEFKTMPEIEPKEGKFGVIVGCNLETKELLIEYYDIPEPEPIPEPTPPEPSPQDIINATNTTMLLKISKALGV